jgi:ferredoxin-NADP reductase
LEQAGIIALTGLIAMASKYVLAFRGRHIFNPAAIAAVIVGFSGLEYASWWIANNVMWPFVLIGGILILRKIRRFQMFFVYFVIATLAVLVAEQYPLQNVLYTVLVSWPFLFLGSIMLTEPSTTPPTRRTQLIYAAMIGLLMMPGLSLGRIFMTPELALVIGNVFSFLVGIRQRPVLRLIKRNKLSAEIYEFVFEPIRKFKFKAGQYLEITLPVKNVDERGNRRNFTIASSPTDKEVRIGVKFYEPMSRFKSTLKNLEPGQTIGISNVAGDFTLPADAGKKLAFIAGGIGITPFRSMAEYLIDTEQNRDTVLFYSASGPDEIVFDMTFKKAKKHGLEPVYISGGRITSELINKHTPDFKDRLFYISGPVAMVNGMKKLLKNMGVNGRNIKTDYFVGY